MVFWTIVLLSFAGRAGAADLRLLEAARNQDTDEIRSLLTQHIDVNARQGDGATALAWAAHWNDLEAAEVLIRAGADVSAADQNGVTPLWLACLNASTGMVEKLVKAGANPNATLPATGETVLMECANTGNPDAIKALLTRDGVELNAKEKNRGQTALMWAIEGGHPEAARVLIEHGADVYIRSKGGFTPLLFACRQNDVETARTLIERGANVNEPAPGVKGGGERTRVDVPGGSTPLLVAADSGKEEVAILLVEKGADVNAADPDGLTALHLALKRGMSILRFVHSNDDYIEPVAYLLRPDLVKLVNVLLEHGAKPNPRITGYLTRLDSKPTTSDRPQLALAGATPLLLAAAGLDVEVMRTLTAHGADPKLTTLDKSTTLMAAAGLSRVEPRTDEEMKRMLEAVKMLVEAGVNVNAVSDNGKTALHAAAFSEANDVIQYLVEKGGKLDAEDAWGSTPLSIAEGDPNILTEPSERAFNGKFGGDTAKLIRKLAGKPEFDDKEGRFLKKAAAE